MVPLEREEVGPWPSWARPTLGSARREAEEGRPQGSRLDGRRVERLAGLETKGVLWWLEGALGL